MIEDPRKLDNTALDARLRELQKRAFNLYEEAAQRAEGEPAHRDAFYAQAQDDVAPLLTEAKRLHDERVRRLRLRARRWRRATLAVAALGLALLARLLWRR